MYARQERKDDGWTELRRKVVEVGKEKSEWRAEVWRGSDELGSRNPTLGPRPGLILWQL